MSATDQPQSSDSGDGPPPMPRWVKAFGTGVLALILLVIIMMVAGVGGHHGPGRHMHFRNSGADTPPATNAPRP
jgi:hypothetical protein